ncbi:MAG: hypothetical protein Q8865_03360 [Bacillota bacterium]|nr:hypothetical protein [Bacillota bacterium]
MSKKYMPLNLASNIIMFSVSFGISFFLSPFIIDRLGREAYGFIGLIGNFISYASIVTIALNSMAGRFITIKIHEDDMKSANIYFNSVLIGNLFLSLVFLIISAVLLINLQLILHIPEHLTSDVKTAFFLATIEFIISLISSVFGVATFVRNKLYLSSWRSIQSNIIRVTVIIILFTLMPARISFLNIATLTAAVFVLFTNIHFTRTLTPDIKISKIYYNACAVIELLKCGVWNTFSRLSQILNTGLDLLLTNIFLGASLMGTLNISKTLPTYFITFTATIVSVFAPELTIAYAHKNTEQIIKTTKQSVKIMTFFTSLFFAFIIIYSKQFYKLWLPSQDANLIYILTVLSVIHMPLSSGVNSLYNIFTITNKVKTSSLVLLSSSILNVIIVVTCVKILPQNVAIYAVAGISSMLALLVVLFFTVPFASACLKISLKTFYHDLILCIIGNVIASLIFLSVKYFIPATSWTLLLAALAVSGILTVTVNFFVLLNSNERAFLIDRLLKRGQV